MDSPLNADAEQVLLTFGWGAAQSHSSCTMASEVCSMIEFVFKQWQPHKMHVTTCNVLTRFLVWRGVHCTVGELKL